MGFVVNFVRVSAVKRFENRLTFDKITLPWPYGGGLDGGGSV